MSLVYNLLPIFQIILSILIVAAVLLQQSDAGIGGAFGGGEGGGMEHTRRGFEKFLFNGTIVLAILFALSAFLALIL